MRVCALCRVVASVLLLAAVALLHVLSEYSNAIQEQHVDRMTNGVRTLRMNVSSGGTGAAAEPRAAIDVCAKHNLTLPNRQPVDVSPPDWSQCQAIMQGDAAAQCRWSRYKRITSENGSDEREVASDLVLTQRLGNCSRFLSSRQYPTQPASKAEREFPIAFSLLAHRDAAQLERVLRLMYAPQNVYCIHVDAKAPSTVHAAAGALAECLPNVIVTQSELVYWGGFSVLKATLNCARDLLAHGVRWKYLLNVAAQDVPLKTNGQLVQILTALNGSNDVELDREQQPYRYWFGHRILRNAAGQPVTHVPDWSKSKLPVPNRLHVYKGNLAASLSRPFVEFVFNDARAQQLLAWLEDTDVADEHLWATVNHNAQLRAPGGYPGDCMAQLGARRKQWISRYVLWSYADRDTPDCHGLYVHDVCVFGVGDLPRLPSLPHLFANKMQLDGAAFDCYEMWMLRQQQLNRPLTDRQLLFYKQLDGVQWKRNGVCSSPSVAKR